MTIQVVAGAQTTTVTKTISATDLTRFIAAYRTRFDPIIENVGGKPTPRALTDAEVVQAWAEQLFYETKGTVRTVEAQNMAGIVLT